MSFSVKEICKKINGVILGSSHTIVKSSSGIEKTTRESICYIDDVKFMKIILSGNIKASVIIIESHLIGKLDLSLEKIITKNKNLKSIIKVENAKESFANVLCLFTPNNTINEIDQKSHIAHTAKIGETVHIGAFCYIDEESEINDLVKIYPSCFIGKNVSIGTNTIIHAGVKIYDNTKIGSNCIIHSGVVLGSDGFGFIPQKAENKKIPHLGNVIIENNVEIGANSCVDRGTTHSDSTMIKQGAKLDNLVQIGHNVSIGRNTIIAGCTGIAGSTTIGNNCLIGGKVAIADHLEIADNIKIAGNSGVTKSFLKKGIIIQGPIAFNQKDFQKSYIHFRKKGKD